MSNLVKYKARTWTDKEGRVIPIEELSDDHLANILRFLQRRAYERWLNDAYFALSCARRHTEVQKIEKAISQMMTSGLMKEEITSYFPLYKHLINEALKRKLFWESQHGSSEEVSVPEM